ncbi:MAG: hypothetical protein HY820_21215 [Acidobacteria bacterium]|nr:hypothetical protein [Acidobacteriota bacterium]
MRLLLACLLAAAAHGAVADCRPCHAARVKAQSATPHARALAPYSGEHFAGRRIIDRGGNSYNFTATGLTLQKGDEKISAPVAWAFGSGEQAMTLVLSRGGRWVEHRLSWYRNGDRLGLTPGHEPALPFDLEEALGVVQTDRNATRCFGCHRPNEEPGVHCQACHGEALEHRKAPGRGNVRRDTSIGLCATCHRTPDATFVSAQPEMEDPRSIRFAPIGFQVSKCFQKSTGFTCVSCHDPHGEPRGNVNGVCASCHSRESARCPRVADACVSCHMKQSSPIPALRFTDHRIRVYLD